tara:strand:+ start:3011 stop:3586 length:576 start_codon:yes stop_codon:yes gene_type:complete
MKSIIFIILFPIILFGQEVKNHHSTGFGLSNTLGLFNNILSEKKTKPSFFVDYKNKSDSLKHYRLNLLFDLPYIENNSKTIDNFFISVGIEKDYNESRFENINFFYGFDIFYKMTLKKAKLFPVSSSNYGFGFLGLVGLDFYIKEDITINSEFNYGIGFQQSEIVSANLLITWERKFFNNKLLSIGLRKYF